MKVGSFACTLAQVSPRRRHVVLAAAARTELVFQIARHESRSGLVLRVRERVLRWSSPIRLISCASVSRVLTNIRTWDGGVRHFRCYCRPPVLVDHCAASLAGGFSGSECRIGGRRTYVEDVPWR